jgi:hypothetical protein
MTRSMRSGATVIAMWLLPFSALADVEAKWSTSVEAVVKDFESPVNDDDATGFFDLYEFTSGKSYTNPFQLGISDLDLDLLGAQETPLMQFRFQSPTSNLSLTGSNETPFLNQRADLFMRPEGVLLDLDYRRMRTDELRLFPNPSGIGTETASRFNDDTSAGDRFYTQRTRVGGAMRLRLGELLEPRGQPLAENLPEISLRGRYEKRDGQRQFRYMLDSNDWSSPTSSWRARTSKLDQRVGNAGAGLVLTPGGLFTLSLDIDGESFRENAPAYRVNQIADPGVIPSTATVNFIPDTDRITGSAQLQRRFGERAALYGGFQGTSLKQVGNFTPNQLAAGLRDNAVRSYSANAGGNLMIVRGVSANAFFKYDNRDNRIQRNTMLFNPSTGDPNQTSPFLEALEELEAGGELVYRPQSTHLVALGYRGRWVNRDLDFADPTGQVILPTNTVIRDDSNIQQLYLRGRARLLRGLGMSAEAGYQSAPNTGYIRELTQAYYFSFRGTYSAPTSHPLDFALFGNGEFGKNTDFQQRSEAPGFSNPNRDFQRSNYSYGVTATYMPRKPLTLFSSFFQHRDAQMFDLVRSNAVRYLEPTAAAVSFFKDNPLDYRADLTNVLFGGTYQISERTEATISYSYTHSNSHFEGNNATSNTLRDASKILSDIHSVDARVGHWLADGLRVYVGYRFDDYLDHTTVPAGTDSVATTFDRSTRQHTGTLGVTLTSALLHRP